MQSVKVNEFVLTMCHSNLVKIVNIVNFLKALLLQNTYGGYFRNVKEKMMLFTHSISINDL